LLHATFREDHTSRINVAIVELANAAFVIGNEVAYPGLVKANQFVLVQDLTIYSKFAPTLFDSGTVAWEVRGYDNSDIFDTATFPGRISIHSIRSMDTVSKSQGFIIPYIGSDSTRAIIAYARFDPGVTRLLKDSLSAVTGSGATGKAAPDQGYVSFLPEDLFAFTPDRYISVEVIRYEYHIRTSTTGHKVGVLTECISNIPLYLKP
jgi:hypothetical protein